MVRSNNRQYEANARTYSRYRHPDARIQAKITACLGDSRRIVNVGAGSGSYEPNDRDVIAVEPSDAMIRERTSGSTLAVRAVAERLPFPADSFDAAMAILTVHHWDDWRKGLSELRRVACRQVVLTFDASVHNSFWLIAEYIPAARELRSVQTASIEVVAEALSAKKIEVLLVPHDCTDGFGVAYWRRPQRYLESDARRAISMLAELDEEQVLPGINRLETDLRTGRWQRRHEDLLTREDLDVGLRLLTSWR